MIIGITINEVLRDFIGQLAYVYSKYESEIDLKETPVDEWNLLNYFKFKDEETLNKFLYTEASLEVFGHADQLHENIVTKLNTFSGNLLDEEEHEVVIISREADKAIPSTLFFLSKLGFTGNNLKFVTDTAKKWDYVDILITANPKALESKPEGKISVKVDSTYNTEINSDYAVESLTELIDDEEFINKILS